MGIVDYNFYKNTFKGNVINEEDTFIRHTKNAERLLQALVLNSNLSDIPNIKDCICEMLEASFLYSNSHGIVSESIGGHSITYDEKHNQNKRMYDIAYPYIMDYMNRSIKIVH